MSSISLIQMTSSAEVSENLATAFFYLKQAKASGATLALLPENFAFMGRGEADKLAIAEPLDNGPIQATLSKYALQLGLWIVAGTIAIRSSDASRAYAASLVYNAEGKRIACYNKIHLFDVDVGHSEAYCESASTIAGKDLVCIDSPVGQIGLSVCYDLRFPELYRRLQVMGAEVLLVPSAFTFTTGQLHWATLLRARAIENLCYVIGANQTGLHVSGRKTFGHSRIYSPWGELLADLADVPGSATTSIDLEQLHTLRGKFPCLRHRQM